MNNFQRNIMTTINKKPFVIRDSTVTHNTTIQSIRRQISGYCLITTYAFNNHQWNFWLQKRHEISSFDKNIHKIL